MFLLNMSELTIIKYGNIVISVYLNKKVITFPIAIEMLILFIYNSELLFQDNFQINEHSREKCPHQLPIKRT